MRNYKTDKKRNAAYWDEIDATIERMVCDVADFSDTKFEDDVLDDMISDGIVADVREIVINYLIEKGGNFPYVDEDM
jgi:hypothetical protein